MKKRPIINERNPQWRELEEIRTNKDFLIVQKEVSIENMLFTTLTLFFLWAKTPRF